MAGLIVSAVAITASAQVADVRLLAPAEIISVAPELTELTIYRPSSGGATSELSLDAPSDGLAMVTETRTVELPAGDAVIRFRDVADRIVPQTAKLTGLSARIGEVNFDYNLLTPGALLEKSIGRSVRLIRTNRANGRVTEQRGVVRSGPVGAVIDFADEGVEALRCSGLDERLAFDDVPRSLSDTPTLSMVVRGASVGTHRVQLSYLATGFEWSADYVAHVHPDTHTLDLDGWVTLVNHSRTRFADADVHVVAGRLSLIDGATVAPAVRGLLLEGQCWSVSVRRALAANISGGALQLPGGGSGGDGLEAIIVTGSRIVRESELGDYKLYTVPFATTVESQQIKQVRLLERHDVAYERVYSYLLEPDNFTDPERRTGVWLRLRNTRRDGLGLPLPEGDISLFDAGTHREILAGQSRLDDVPSNMPFDVSVGTTRSVIVTPRVVREEEIETKRDTRSRVVLELQLANDESFPVLLEIGQALEAGFTIAKQSRRHMLRRGLPTWTIRLAAGERQVLTYTLEHREPIEDDGEL